ncbi:uncharacterized protein N7482_009525 [Penicillium canariense]|uniref:Uncharacterized protein n=1 Tax=Penicillium canariense TaxID=189055 RepID=A0A9W9HPF2_9EURO|nr:uncharacterized protein N7482_009525 [Penicillium canariense]KAJ5153047.1 hypothetical protein N7482_009525 [Penicillium canariense]
MTSDSALKPSKGQNNVEALGAPNNKQNIPRGHMLASPFFGPGSTGERGVAGQQLCEFNTGKSTPPHGLDAMLATGKERTLFSVQALHSAHRY